MAGPVGLHGAVPGQVVGGEVQRGRGFRVEIADRLQLVAGAFQREPGAGPGPGHGGDQRGAQVAAGHRGQVAGLEQVRGEVGGGALAVGAGDREHQGAVGALAQGAVGQLQLADDGDAAGRGLPGEGASGRHPGAEHHFVAPVQQGERVAAPHPRHRQFASRAAARGSGSGRRSVTTTSFPALARNSAAPSPERPAPTTTIRPM